MATNQTKWARSTASPAGAKVTAWHVLRSKPGRTGLVSIGPDKRMLDAVILMELHEISDLPVVEGTNVVGNLSELAVARLMHRRASLAKTSVAEVMDVPLLEVDVRMDILEVYRLLSEGRPGLIVRDAAEPVGFLNRLDLIEYWRGWGRLERSTA